MNEPARDLPQLAVACPTCQAKPGDLCTSHSGTRQRRNDTHQTRTRAWAEADHDNPMTAETLAKIRRNDERDLRLAEKPFGALNETAWERHVLLAEVDRLKAEVEQRGKDLATWQHVAGQHQAAMFDTQAERDRLHRGMRDLNAQWRQRAIDNGDYYNRTAAKYEHGKAVAFDAAAQEIRELIAEQAPDTTGGA